MTSWSAPARPLAQIEMRFGEGQDRKLLRNFSGATRFEEDLFLAADERAGIDRLSLAEGIWSDHRCFQLADLLDLAYPGEEADLEGVAVDDGWLWLVGSHARTRPKFDKEGGECIDLVELANLRDTRPRCLLARVPLRLEEGAWSPVRQDGSRKSGLLRQTKRGNLLSKALRKDPLLAAFTKIPAKEGGIDVEGIAVQGTRIALGLRGPVVRTYAVLLEMEVEPASSGELRLAAAPAKRLLALEGLGIRDLKRCGDDLLILAGPTVALSGPCAIHRWRDWAHDPVRHDQEVRLHRPEHLIDLPFGRGVDHPEGLVLWPSVGGQAVLVVCDSPSPDRLDTARKSLKADLFELPS
ncbi:MAG TPA: DUF3616 domain-containing protein [Sphingobium sp.]|nr:DUF3616 domain-containing protein [Sphingobium sp.]